ncbi:hypothetical protein RRU94_04075 [Domibacillus sp. DTU_2020_1001157_1_SI_ALB_TIR_016]|uniref:hypothetical protein n=1 Tax=Domibacillus sp. DTU_2020_1001157_1_SI_ALB_TIR_016 TaxID=3077789 RepID=UPI0028EFAD15|nr:hypothetical protein [Domibacillus sp. DTU_2020_1001157_1_SI_ALB_TIR_016]WNS77695.1 hypothetical protein RRU94_04075 [Domibacillus sp. DTU_2020_1001157_1_SI_ALB_TIR_016]
MFRSTHTAAEVILGGFHVDGLFLEFDKFADRRSTMAKVRHIVHIAKDVRK